MDKMDLENQLELLCNVSSTIDSYIHNKEYLLDTTDNEPSDYELLDRCYILLKEEIEELGIKFICDNDELFSSRYNINYLIKLKSLFSINTLVDMFKVDKEIVDYISNLLSSISYNELAVYLLDYFKNKFKNDFYNELYIFLFDKITSTDKLAIYLSKVIETFINDSYDLTKNDEIDITNQTSLLKDFINYIKSKQRLFVKYLSLYYKEDRIDEDIYKIGISISKLYLSWLLREPNFLVIKYLLKPIENKHLKPIAFNYYKSIRDNIQVYKEFYKDEQLTEPDVVIVFINTKIDDLMPNRDKKTTIDFLLNTPYKELIESIQQLNIT